MTERYYWESFYKQSNAIEQESLFAKFCLNNFFIKNPFIIELGCGNGRDSIYFLENSCKVLGIDLSDTAIEIAKNNACGFAEAQFIKDDFTNLKNIGNFDVVYSRFTLHSVSQEKQKEVLKFAYKQLVKNGLFCIEVRGKKNELYCKGSKVVDEKDAYIYEDHYRCFVDFEDLKNDLICLGFGIEFSAEERGFSPFQGENQTFIRVIARKS